jgi:histidine ammonia-lyase
MAPWAGLKLIQIQKNVNRILAIELIVAGAANYLISSNLKSGQGTSKVLDILKKCCSFRKGDRSLTSEIESVSDILSSGNLYRDISQHLTLE